MKKISIYLFFVFCLAYLLFAAFSLLKLRKIKSESKKVEIYNLSPVVNASHLVYLTDYIPPNPAATVDPNNKLKYLLMQFKEYLLFKSGEVDRLYLAAKRISETANWLDRTSTAVYKGNLGKYAEFIKTDIREKETINSEIEKIDKLSLIKGYLRFHLIKLNNLIAYSSRNEKEKKNLNDFTEKTFESLIAMIDKKIVKSYNPFVLNYSLSDIISRHETGVYDLTIKTKDFPTYVMNMSVIVGNKVFFPKKIADGIRFERIRIDGKEKNLNLLIPEKILKIKGNKWTVTNDDNGYSYSLSLSRVDHNLNYLISVKYYIPEPSKIEFVDEQRKIFENILLSGKDDNYQKITFLKADSEYQIHLVSAKPIPASTLVKIETDIKPVIDPLITLQKIE